MQAKSPSSKSVSQSPRADFGRRLGLCGLLLPLALLAGARPVQVSPPASPDGLIIAEVKPNSPAAKAGLRAGDVLLSYAGRPLSSPFAFFAATQNCFGGENVAVKAIRGSQILEMMTPSWVSKQTGLDLNPDVIVQPGVSPEMRSLFMEGLAKFDAKDWEAATAKWRAAWQIADMAGDKKVSAWLCVWIAIGHSRLASGSSERKNPTEDQIWIKNMTEARNWLLHAWEDVKEGADHEAQANILINIGFANCGINVEAALPWLEQAHSAAVQSGNELWAATARDVQGLILMGRFAPGSPNYRHESIANEKNLAPTRLCFIEAMEIRKRILPASLPLANSLENIGILAALKDDLAEEQKYYDQAFTIYQHIDPKSKETSRLLNSLGEVAILRGDALSAQRYYREALPLIQGADINSQVMRIMIIWHQGLIFAMQGDFEQAKQSLQEARDAFPKSVKGAQEFEAGCLTGLEVIAAAQNELPQAKKYCLEALALGQKGFILQDGKAVTLNTLGLIATSERQFAQAKTYYQEALDIWQAVKPKAAGKAVSLDGLGAVAMAEGNLAEAQAKFEQAQRLLHENFVGDDQEASFLANMGRLHLLQQYPEKALPLLEQATAILEKRRQGILDLDTRALFMQAYANPFADLMQTYIALHQPDKAFATLERLHARSFADNLAEWQLKLDQNLPQNLRVQQQDLANARHISEKDFQRASEKKEAVAKAKAQASLDSLAAQQRQLDAAIRQDYVQRIGHNIEYPQPIDRQTAQQALPPGVLALAYAVDDDSVRLFALTKTSFHIYPLSLSPKRLKERVQQARDTMTDIHNGPKTCEGILNGLYRDLLFPAQAEIRQAHSLLVCPDGILNLLPFAALMPTPGRFLIQDKPIAITASLTAYHSLRAQNRPPMTSLLALGDPTYNLGGTSLLPNRAASMSPKSPAAKSAKMRTMGARLEPLPETGELAKEIKAQYAPNSIALLQKQATVTNFLDQSGQVDIVHVGCHAVADDRHPFGSWLLLTPDAKDDDGRLFAWQILHRRLNAKLVVLWGCGTGLGQENRYEGILGLPYAFQTAGAENVLTTLWEVPPKETLPILREFYRLCKANGKAKTLAETLQAAQIKAIKTDPRPYFWASFVLNGVGE